MANQRLELTWVGKGEDPAIEPRILLHDPSKDYGDSNTENMLIHGDNLLALKALEQEYAGQVKCVYIDPPFNTGQAFKDYDDNLEHSTWLNLMNARLKVLYNLLDINGMLWVHLDDIEVHYCKVLLDEIFSRHNFVAHITYERSAVAGLGQGGYLVNTTEHILLYKKGLLPNKTNYSYEELGFNIMKRYNRYVSEFGERKLLKEFVAKSNGEKVKIYEHSDFLIETIPLRDSKNREAEIRTAFAEHLDSLFRGNRVQKENEFQNDIISELEKDKLYSVDYIPRRGKNEGVPTTLYYYNCELLSWLKDTTSLSDGNMTKATKMTTLWKHGEIPKADIANEGGVNFPRSKKPEQLLRRIIEMSTDPGDIVLDSFLGSGTTAAVAHKMGRRYIGIELGDHCYTHCKPRLDAVIDGEHSGISKAVNWHGGGGYKFYELAPTLIVKDKYGNPVFSEQYSPEMLVAAVAKINGYHYAPDSETFWKQGFCQDNSFIYITTQYLTGEVLDCIAAEVGAFENLLICAPAFDTGLNKRYENITVRKIPQSVLDKCQYGVDNYNLNIIDPPALDEEEWEDD